MASCGSLGPTLKRLRDGRRLEVVAAAAGLSADVLRSIEAGYYVPTVEGLRTLCGALRLNMVETRQIQDARLATIKHLQVNPWAASRVRRAS